MAKAAQNPFAIKAIRVAEVIKAFMQEVPDLMTVYMFEQMGEDIGAGPFRDQEAGALSLRAPINETNNLRIQTGKLSRAFTPGEEGNISIVDGKPYKAKKGKLSAREALDPNLKINVEFGIDLKVVPYARIHEYGGDAGRNKAVYIKPRPYLRNGYDAFIAKEVPRFFKRLVKAIEE